MSAWGNKVILITGASSGIGAGTALHFAAAGAKLSLVARTKTKLEEVAAQCRQAGSEEVLVCQHDLSVESECVEAVKETLARFGTINVLVNNAGILCRADFEHVTMDNINQSMNINLNSAVKMSQECMEQLKKVKGNIVNVSSIAGLRPYPGSIAYKMSKAAMDQFTRCLALEVAGSGVRVNSVNPGVIHTDIFAASGMSEAEIADYYTASEQLHPLGRIGTVDEVAKAIAFLASEDASFITGQTLAVDGGRSLPLPYKQI